MDFGTADGLIGKRSPLEPVSKRVHKRYDPNRFEEYCGTAYPKTEGTRRRAREYDPPVGKGTNRGAEGRRVESEE